MESRGPKKKNNNKGNFRATRRKGPLHFIAISRIWNAWHLIFAPAFARAPDLPSRCRVRTGCPPGRAADSVRTSGGLWQRGKRWRAQGRTPSTTSGASSVAAWGSRATRRRSRRPCTMRWRCCCWRYAAPPATPSSSSWTRS